MLKNPNYTLVMKEYLYIDSKQEKNQTTEAALASQGGVH